MDDVFALTSSAFPDTTRVASFRGREAIGEPYEFELFLIVPSDDAKGFDFADAVGTKAKLASHVNWRQAFVFHGILATVELVHAHGLFALFRAVLVPRLRRLALTHHSRLFTQQAFPDILKAVLQDNGLTANDFSLQLTGTYPVEEHVCQYRESDLAFVSRWMEHLGIYYFFEQGDAAEKVVVTDAKSSHTDLPSESVRYVPTLGEDRSATGEAIESFRCRATSLPASVKLKDYDYTKPTLDVSGSATVSASGMGEISIYAGRVFTPDDATKFAQLRAEELLAGQLEHFGSGTNHLRAGYTFTLDEHPLDALNQKYLATRCEHFGNLISESPDLARRIDLPYKDVYRCEVTAIPAKVQFRSERRTPWPRVYGLEHGLIDGAQDSDYAQLEATGRYRVKFFFDESPLKDGKASTLVRMMQPHGGGIEGFHFPLRKGTEVLVSFLGGDPDRPVITGVVPNAHTPSPVTSGNNTTNVIQTGGRNRIELEDKEGQQRITISTPTANSYIRFGAPNDGHEMIINSDGATELHAGKSWDVIVGTFLSEQVVGYCDEKYLGDYHNTHVAGTRKNEVVGAITETFQGGRQTTLTGNDGLTVTEIRGEHYGTHKSKVDGLAQHTYGTLEFKCGSVTGNSGAVGWESGAITLTAPSVTINAPDVKLNTSTHHILGPTSFDTFVTKHLVGVESFTATAIKTEVFGVSASAGPLKADTVGIKVDNIGLRRQTVGADIKNMGAITCVAVLKSLACGFVKIG